MISLSDFVNAIYTAILAANDALTAKNFELLEKYFEEVEDSDESQKTFNDEVETILKDILDPDRASGQQRPPQKKIETLLKSLQEIKARSLQSSSEEAGQSPSYQSSSKGDTQRVELPDKLRPKMTTIQFPQKTANGVVLSDVKVPAITLVPLSMTQISEVKLHTELEIQVEGEELLVGFSTAHSDKKSNESRNSSRVTLQIALTPHHGTEGLRQIIEGYEKILRAQIPN
ncbi:MAG: DUF2589 domain-containing protein [Cyanobacteria bacterium P01_G01_bin.54]